MCLALCLLTSMAGSTAAQETNHIATLIRELGADSHKERTDAMHALWQIGLPARDALERATHSDDPEVGLTARTLLRDITHGVRPSWPEALRRQARGYIHLSSGERIAFMDRLIQTVNQGAIPFLLMRVEAGKAQDAGPATDRLKNMLQQDAQWRDIIQRLPQPVNPFQARLLALACEAVGTLAEISKALDTPHLEANMKTKLINISVVRLQENVARGEYARVAEAAAALAEAVSGEARFLYLQAIAAAGRGQSQKARTLEKSALALNADAESPHYTAGEMLNKMGRPHLSEQEWLRILEIPPAGDVYDINAHLRLAAIYAADHKHTQAADAYDAVVKLYETARREHGSGYGIVGTDVKGLARRAADQRRYAAGECKEPAAKHHAAANGGKIQVGLTVSLKDGKLADMQQALSAVAMTMQVNVQPRGVRLFRDAKARLTYDVAKQEFNVMLNNSACSKARPYKLEQAKTKVAVNTLDMCYIYAVERGTGRTTELAAFEKDYLLTVEPSPELRAWRETTISLNEKATTWEALQKGVPFDYLPKTFDLKIEGIDPSGQDQKFHRTLDPEALENAPQQRQEPTAVKLQLIGIQ
jgi:tetratricopeptide (TPR) repeat protein